MASSLSSATEERTASDGGALARDFGVAAMILIGGALNGLMVKIIEGLESGVVSLTLGLSPFQIIALLVAGRLVLVGRGRALALPWWCDGLALGLMLVPSSAVAWAGVGLYASMAAVRWSGERRTGALLFLALAATALWSSVMLKWFSGPVTSAEAWVVGQVVGLLRPDIIQTGNVIGNPAIHSLILMTACTSTDALPMAALALVATAVLLGRIDGRRMAWALGILALCYVVGNVARLAAMSWSGEMYGFWHGTVGRNIFDAAQIGLVLALGNWASRP